ncbi:unnamed protein product [Amoebophrya sp. A120]|nr:unnamed protein product [Amoebophrya sp. A120]|eukprot:GSA120T00017420001.1
MWWARERVKLPGQEAAPATATETVASEEVVKLAIEFGDLETACSYLSSRLTQMNVMCDNLKAKNDDLKRCRDVSDKLQALIKRFEKQHQELVAERRKSSEVERLRQRNARLEVDNEKLARENSEMKLQMKDAIALVERRAAIETPMVKARAGMWEAETRAKLEEYRLKGSSLAEICAQQQAFIEEHFLRLLLQADNGDPMSMPEGKAMAQYDAWRAGVDAGKLTFDPTDTVPELSLFGDGKPALSHRSPASRRQVSTPQGPSEEQENEDAADEILRNRQAERGEQTGAAGGAGASSEQRPQELEHDGTNKSASGRSGAGGGGSDDGAEGEGATHEPRSDYEQEVHSVAPSSFFDDEKKRSVGTQFPPPPLQLSLFSHSGKNALADRQKGALDDLHVTI